MFEVINRLLGFIGDLLEADPHQNRTGNVIADNPGFPTLATFQASQLFGFAVKLLDFPTKATHLLYSLRVVLRHIVCDDIVRALGRKHYSEKFHFMRTRKAFDLDYFALSFFNITPGERVYSLVGLRTTRIIHLAVVFERTVVNLLIFLNCQHDFLGSIPTVHQNSPKSQVLLIDTIDKHLLHMINFRFSVSIRIIEPVVYDPKLI